MRILFIVLAVMLVLGMGGVGIAAYLLTRPQPVISVTSDFHVGSTPAGSIGTVFHVSGHKFSGTSVIILLLDGLTVPGLSRVASDADGNGTRGAVSVIIVPQGQAHTPGPNGAPADDMSFTLDVNVQYQEVTTGKHGSYTALLIISGRSDPAGGTVCQSEDNGQPQTYQGDAGNGLTYTETTTSTCSGTYKGGKLSYIEIAASDKFDYSDGVSCVVHQPHVLQHLEGTFNAPTSISGNFSEASYTTGYNKGVVVSCITGYNKGVGTFQDSAVKGTWTGQL